ncbi:hypothetical protein FNF28_03504 [Cafeteria roenbergensis]|uniref:Uncharacterized protein n=1 Tax=Cafeteria roenbergensis TaxID=33653 RepID=A0A5A8DI88_CAFRO|nr:hypothetical protein FNF28_03504 [Cafeteria roenbergensis]
MRSIVASAALAFAALASTVSAGSFSESDAKSMVYLAGAAYCDASALRSWSCGQACNGPLSVVPGTITVVQNSSMDLQAYVGQLSDGRAIVSFRGTQPSKLADWIDDLKSAFATTGKARLPCDGESLTVGYSPRPRRRRWPSTASARARW